MKIAKGLFASIIILVISGLAFTAGFLRESVVNQIEETKSTVAEEEINTERIEAKISDIVLFDYHKLTEARTFKENALADAHELNWTRYDITANEINVLHTSIEHKLNRYEQMVRETNLYDLIQHFELDSNESDYYFTTISEDGYDFSISSDEFHDKTADDNLYLRRLTPLFLNNYPPSSSYYQDNLTLVWTTFTINIKEDNWVELYRDELYQKQLLISSLETNLRDFEGKASFYSYGVTLITITTILASAMANQINDKEREKDFSHIKGHIYDNNSMVISRTKRWPMTLLLVALFFAILGLVLPMILGLIW